MDTYDCAIIGGGLAGLALAIQLADNNVKVVLFEKNEYPFHKVCGEYISMESWPFLTSLGVPLADMELPMIKSLGISSEKGFMLNHQLEMGGFGVSRYRLDQLLCEIALRRNVVVLQQCKVNNVEKAGDLTRIQTSAGLFYARVVCGSYGKYVPSFLRNHMNYTSEQSGGSQNYIGVKYHIQTDLAEDRIELHNFKNGYCGISRVEDGKYCLCYLTTAENLQQSDKDIKSMERKILFRNPYLQNYFTTSKFLSESPLIISNVTFRKKQTAIDDIFLIGDSAGTITPLCGNGMSMALRSSQLLANALSGYFERNIPLREVLFTYEQSWNTAFKKRITAGFYLQYLFGKRAATDLALKVLAKTPLVMKQLVSLTHGDVF